MKINLDWSNMSGRYLYSHIMHKGPHLLKSDWIIILQVPQKYLPHGTLNQFTNPVQSPNQVTTRVWVPQSQIQNGIQELRLELSMSMQWATNPNPPTYTHSIVGGPRSKSQPKSFGFWLWPSDSGLTKKTFVWLDWLVPLKSNSLTCVLIALNSSSYGNDPNWESGLGTELSGSWISRPVGSW